MGFINRTLFFSILVLNSGCSLKHQFSGTPNIALTSQTQSGSGSPSGSEPSPQTPNSPGNPQDPSPEVPINQVLNDFRPSFAVRAVGCTICHANITSNVMSDFGYGESWYFGNGGLYDSSYYANADNAWQTSAPLSMRPAGTGVITGTLIVPKAPISATLLNSVKNFDPAYNSNGVTSLAQFLDKPFAYKDKTDGNVIRAMTDRISSPTRVTEISKLVIHTPNEATLRTLWPQDKPLPPIGWSRTFFADPASKNKKEVSGLELVNASTPATAYVRNTPNVPLICYGDLVINGTLFLNQAKIETDDQGCRLYVTQSVFIQGAISYIQNGSQYPNIQISSARAIAMGLGNGAQNDGTFSDYGYNSIKGRLLGKRSVLSFTRGAPNQAAVDQRDAQIIADSEKIGVLLRDAAAPDQLNLPGANAPELDYAASWKNPERVLRASINFERVLLNAPMIHSRYLGKVTGTVVAEIALFALGELKFQYDPHFGKADVLVLPLLPKLLEVTH